MSLTCIENLTNYKRAVLDDFDKGYNYCLDELKIIAPEHITYIEKKEVETDNGIDNDYFCHNCQGFWDPEKNADYEFCPYCGAHILKMSEYLYITEGIHIEEEKDNQNKNQEPNEEYLNEK